MALTDLWVLGETQGLGGIVALSIAVSVTAAALAGLLGTALGAGLAVYRVPGPRIIVVALHALLGLPPVVVGLALYLLLSRAGPFLAGGLAVLAGGASYAADKPTLQSILLASTTSVDNSGLLARIIPIFTKESGIEVRVLAQGTGQALATAAHGDADLVLVHDPEAEQKFIAAGDGVDRRQIAWNDFIIVGPRTDPAHTAGGHDAIGALKAIAAARASFVSRGDKSGTDALEHRLWRVAEIDPAKADGGEWYRDIGGGMGAALNTAQAMGAYTISDRGTWLSFGNKGDLAVLVEGDPRLLNRYDVILLDPKRHPEAKQQPARRFARWLVSPEGQAAIGGYKVKGEQLFHPSADAPK